MAFNVASVDMDRPHTVLHRSRLLVTTGMSEATHLEPHSDFIVLLQTTISRPKLGTLPLLLNIAIILWKI